MLVLRSKEGEMVCVAKPKKWDGTTESLGYPEWEVLEDRKGPPPEHCKWIDDKGWVKDKELMLEAKLNNMTRAEFLEYILEQVRKK